MAEYSLTCVNHPDRRTSLRCNRCNRPICAQCAVQTPVGYRCRDCLRGQQAVFDSARELDAVIAAAVSAAGVGIADYLLSFSGAWGILLAPVVGVALAAAIRALLRGRRGQTIPLSAAIGGVFGVLANIGLVVVSLLQFYRLAGTIAVGLGFLLPFLWPLVHGFVMIFVLHYRLKTPGMRG
jgi:hypothetical protein